MIKLLALDMDGTCLNSQVQLEPETVEAIEKAIAKGITVVPTSGRAFGLLPEEVLNIPGINYAITSNGAVIDDIKTGTEIFRQVISNENILKAIELSEQVNPFLEIYTNGKSFISESDNNRIEEFVPPEYRDFYAKNVKVIPDEEFERCEVFFLK